MLFFKCSWWGVMAQSVGSGLLPPSGAQNRLKVWKEWWRHGRKEKDQPSYRVDWWQRSIWRRYRETIRSDNCGSSDRSQADLTGIGWQRCTYVNKRGMGGEGGKQFPRTAHGGQVVSVCEGMIQYNCDVWRAKIASPVGYHVCKSQQ